MEAIRCCTRERHLVEKFAASRHYPVVMKESRGTPAKTRDEPAPTRRGAKTLPPPTGRARLQPSAPNRSKPHAGGGNHAELRANADLSAYCRALAQPVRVRILKLLIQEHCMFGDVSKRIPLAPSTISQHMKILAEAGLVEFEQVGQSTCWCVSKEGIRALKLMVADL